jgi:hypothetical protein
MKFQTSRGLRVTATLLVTALLTGCGEGTQPAATQPTAMQPTATQPAALPMQKGFYVASDTACSDASTATLLLFQGNALSGARDTCDFVTIEQTGPGAWLVTERCADMADPSGPTTERVVWTSENDSSFRRVAEAGWEQSARLCPAQELPEPWRDTDLSDL